MVWQEHSVADLFASDRIRDIYLYRNGVPGQKTFKKMAVLAGGIFREEDPLRWDFVGNLIFYYLSKTSISPVDGKSISKDLSTY
jgi:hypothetical protein